MADLAREHQDPILSADADRKSLRDHHVGTDASPAPYDEKPAIQTPYDDNKHAVHDVEKTGMYDSTKEGSASFPTSTEDAPRRSFYTKYRVFFHVFFAMLFTG